MNKIHIVMGQKAGFAREDRHQPYVIGAYTNPQTAEQVKRLASYYGKVPSHEV